MLLIKNVTLKSHHSHCDFFNSGMNEITKQCKEIARTIHYLNLHAMPIALLESWRKHKLKILTKAEHARKNYFDLLHCEVLTERKHISTPVNLSSLSLNFQFSLWIAIHFFNITVENFATHQDCLVDFHCSHLLVSSAVY